MWKASSEKQRSPVRVDTSRIRLSLPTGTDMTAIAPSIMVSDGASIHPASGEIINFAANNNKYTYRVTAKNGATRDWLVEISVIDNIYDSLVLIPNIGEWDQQPDGVP